MERLHALTHRDIDWNMTPDEALALSQGMATGAAALGRKDPRPEGADPLYFVVNTWEAPSVTLLRITPEGEETLCCIALPEPIAGRFQQENGHLKGVYPPNEEIKLWLRSHMKE